MHVGLEATAACRPVRTGIARYATKLMQGLAELEVHDLSCRVSGFVRSSRRFKRGHQRPEINGVEWRYYMDPLKPSGDLPDLVHGLELRVPRWARREALPSLATVHDLFGVVADDLLDARGRERNLARYEDVTRHATRILTVSENTRRDLLKYYDFDPERVHVTPLGVDERFKPSDPHRSAAVRARLGLSGPFFLYVGDVTPRKNLVRLIEAFGLSRASADHELILAGSIEDGMPEVTDTLRRCPARERIRMLGFVSEEDLLALYAEAVALLYPTLYEGFGLPILEAFASGTAALGADVGAIPEVAGGHAVLVDPRDVGAIAGGIDRVVEVTPSQRDAARRHARHFSGFTCCITAIPVI